MKLDDRSLNGECLLWRLISFFKRTWALKDCSDESRQYRYCSLIKFGIIFSMPVAKLPEWCYTVILLGINLGNKLEIDKLSVLGVFAA